jgi:hypothetical protein
MGGQAVHIRFQRAETATCHQQYVAVAEERSHGVHGSTQGHAMALVDETAVRLDLRPGALLSLLLGQAHDTTHSDDSDRTVTLEASIEFAQRNGHTKLIVVTRPRQRVVSGPGPRKSRRAGTRVVRRLGNGTCDLSHRDRNAGEHYGSLRQPVDRSCAYFTGRRRSNF